MKRETNANLKYGGEKMTNTPLSFEEFLKKYSYKRSDEIIAYELYLIIQSLKMMRGTDDD